MRVQKREAEIERVTCRCHLTIPARVLAACRRVRARDCCAFCLTEFFRARRVEETKAVNIWFEEAA
jgi:hypothetical protein